MKKIIFSSLMIAAMVAITLSAVNKQSSLMNNPLLTANVEALSAAEIIAPGVIDNGDGTIMIQNAINVRDSKTRKPLNYCEASAGSVCNITAGKSASGANTLASMIKSSRESLASVLNAVKRFFGVK